jgi:transposase InsO family protein
VNTVTLTPEWTPNQLSVWQAADCNLSPVLIALEARQLPADEEIAGYSAITKRYLAEWERLRVVGGVVYRVWFNHKGEEDGLQLLTPDNIKAQILQVAHDAATSGHYGEKKTVAKLRRHFFWPNLLSDVRKYCRSCAVCQKRKPPPTRPHHPLQQEAIGEPLQKVTIDILGFEKCTCRGNRYILVMVDSLTKWAEAFPMPDERAETVARLLVEEFVCRVGIPAQLHSDQGRQFEATIFQEMCHLLGIRKTRTTALHPQSDGQTERLNRTLLDLLAKLAVKEPTDWDLKLPYAMAAYRSTPHTTTGETPNRLMLGREVTTPLQLLTPPPPDVANRAPWVETLHQNFQESYRQVQEHYTKEQRRQKATYDRRQLGYNFKEGDLVWFLEARPKKGTPYKLNAQRWNGPYEVRKRLSAAVYLIGLPRSQKTQVVTTARLKPYIGRPTELQPTETITEEIEEQPRATMEANDGTDTSESSGDIIDSTEIQRDDKETASGPTPSRITNRPRRTVRPPQRYEDFVSGDQFD